MAATRRGGNRRPTRPLRSQDGRDPGLERLDLGLCQRVPLLRLAVGRNARRLVAARMAARRARCLCLRRFQQLAAHRNTDAKGCFRRLERLFSDGYVPRPAHARLALQTPCPRRQRLARPHTGLRHARRTGRGDEELHGAVLGAGAVRLEGRCVRRFEIGQPADLRSPRPCS